RRPWRSTGSARSRLRTRPPWPTRRPRRRARRDPAAARRAAHARLPDHPGDHRAQLGRLDPEPRRGVPRAWPAHRRGPGGHHPRGRAQPRLPHRGGSRLRRGERRRARQPLREPRPRPPAPLRAAHRGRGHHRRDPPSGPGRHRRPSRRGTERARERPARDLPDPRRGRPHARRRRRPGVTSGRRRTRAGTAVGGLTGRHQWRTPLAGRGESAVVVLPLTDDAVLVAVELRVLLVQRLEDDRFAVARALPRCALGARDATGIVLVEGRAVLVLLGLHLRGDRLRGLLVARAALPLDGPPARHLLPELRGELPLRVRLDGADLLLGPLAGGVEEDPELLVLERLLARAVDDRTLEGDLLVVADGLLGGRELHRGLLRLLLRWG